MFYMTFFHAPTEQAGVGEDRRRRSATGAGRRARIVFRRRWVCRQRGAVHAKTWKPTMTAEADVPRQSAYSAQAAAAASGIMSKPVCREWRVRLDERVAAA